MKISNNKIPFGLKDGVLVGVSEVQSGLACGCVCPSCHRKLQANKGKKVSHYFSHDPSKQTRACESAFETSIHLMAKQILSEEGVAKFPELSVKVTQDDKNGQAHEEVGIVTEESLMKFSHVELEKRLEEIRPDIIAYQDSIPYLIEIAVTHFSDSEKVKRIRSKNIHAIEVDLSKVTYTTTKEELTQLIIDKVDNKKWLSNPAAPLKKAEIKNRLEERIRKINENIYKSRQANKVSYVTNPVLTQKKYSTPTHSYRAARTKEYDPRWFLCEACRHIFKVPLKDAPYTIETIQCPECDHAVSAH